MNVHTIINWSSLLSETLEFSVIISGFYFIISSPNNIFVPMFPRRTHSFLQWYSNEIKTLFYNKKRLHENIKLPKPIPYMMNFLA